MALFNASPVREQVKHEIIAALSGSGPMTAAQLSTLCETSESTNMLCQELNKLKKRGEIIECGSVETNSGPRKMYRLPTDADAALITHLEEELAVNRKIVDTDRGPVITYPLSAVIDDLDSAADSQNGDESDPVIQALAAMNQPSFHQDTGLHVDRLRALATHLDDGRTILPQQDIVTWLYDLAATLEEMAA